MRPGSAEDGRYRSVPAEVAERTAVTGTDTWGTGGGTEPREEGHWRTVRICIHRETEDTHCHISLYKEQEYSSSWLVHKPNGLRRRGIPKPIPGNTPPPAHTQT